MDSISAFDFSNEGDCVIANSSLNPHSSSDQACCSSVVHYGIEMTEQQMLQLKTQDESKKLSIRPFIDVIDMNRADEDLVNEITPNPAILVGLKGDF